MAENWRSAKILAPILSHVSKTAGLPLRRSPILISYQTDRLLKITQIIELPSKTGLIKRNTITYKGQEKSIITLRWNVERSKENLEHASVHLS